MSALKDDITIHPVPGRGYLDDIFLARHLSDLVVDASFESAYVPDGMQLLIYNEVDAGLGDVAFATKLMRLLREHIPHLDVILVSTGPQKQQRFGVPDGVVMYSADTFRTEAAPQHRDVDIVVSAPGIFDHCRSQNTVLSSLGLPVSTPFLFVAEYGSMRQLRDDAFKAFTSEIEAVIDSHLDEVAEREGYDPETLGYRSSTGEVVRVSEGNVTTLGHLREVLASCCPSNPLWPWLSQPTLSARSAGFDVGELGVFIEDELDPDHPSSEPQGIGALVHLQDRVLREILESETEPALQPALYAGYAHSSQSIFLDYVAAIERAQNRPIDVVIPNARPAALAIESLFDDAHIARLRAAGIGRLCVLGNVSETTSSEAVNAFETCERRFGAGKTLRLITRYPLPHEDMLTLLRASEDPTMVSGDQSFSEAISARKSIVVIEPMYCQTFHLDAQLALAERVHPELRQVLEFAMQFKWDAKAWKRIVEILQSEQLREHCTRYHRLVHREHRLNDRIVWAVKRALLSAVKPDVAAAQHHLFNDAFEAFATSDRCILKQARLVALHRLLGQ